LAGGIGVIRDDSIDGCLFISKRRKGDFYNPIDAEILCIETRSQSRPAAN